MKARQPLTIFWTTIARGDVSALEEAVREHDATLAHVRIGGLPMRTVPALAAGAVIMVCATNKEASLALSAGVDEVLRCGEVTREALRVAIERAHARALSRSSHSLRRALLAEDDDVALGLLGTALSNELALPLMSATDEVDRLSQSLPPLLDASDDLVAWSSNADSDVPRQIAARRLAGPSSDILKEGVARLDNALQRARSMVEGMMHLSRGADGEVSASNVVSHVVHVLRGSVSAAEITLDAEGPCVCAVSRASVVLTVTALIANALESIRASERDRGSILIRVFSAEQAVIIEVQDDGKEIPADLRPDMFEAYFRDTPSQRPGLPGVRDRVRGLGGDLVIDTGAHGTRVSLILPTTTEFVDYEPAAAPVFDKKALD